MTDAASGPEAVPEPASETRTEVGKGARWAVGAAYAGAALVFAAGGLFPLVAEAVRPGMLAATASTVMRGLGWAAGPAAVLVWSTRRVEGHALAAFAALVGTLLVLALGLALYAAALRPEARLSAPLLALTFVPLRQLVAAAFVGWAVWLARRTR
ncbi:MAG: hypothetical protein AAF845_12095 [Bacteroidota bacterium]